MSPQRDTSRNAQGNCGTVLLIEDERAVRQLVSRFLTAKGFLVLAAEDSVQARELWLAQRAQIDLVLSDIIMACGVSGREIVKEFRADRPNLKVLFMSGLHMEGPAPGDDPSETNFILKPYRPEQLLAAVRATLAGDPIPD